jgi:hypothetical protein
VDAGDDDSVDVGDDDVEADNGEGAVSEMAVDTIVQ